VQFTCLDVWQGHEILGDVNNKLVHKSRSYVQTVHVVIQVVPEIPHHDQVYQLMTIKVVSKHCLC